jgi:nanoRNase/pAp phosphatase (c-di-AMP/oligoRNAs hydrolase)
MAELVDLGVDRPKLEELRRELTKMPQEILRYKARLIERTEFNLDGKLAFISIPNDEIIKFSPLYNPNALIQGEHLQTEGVEISIALKSYADGHLTGGIRSNSSAPIAAELAERFGGGGHTFSSGFKIENNNRPLEDFKHDLIREAAELLGKLEHGK